MGGTFNPIHIGHLILGENAYEQFGLDTVLFMPSGNPPHKRNLHGTSDQQRIDMVARAIEDNDHFELSTVEMHENGYTYTRQTLEKLKVQHPDTDYYFIMGADSLLSFSEWRDPQRISELCTIVVAVRDHLPTEELDLAIEDVKRRFNADVRKLTTVNIDVSSSMIRDWVREGRSFRYYTPDSVVRYILEQHIYEETDNDRSS